jgi:hypothetical protein
VAWGDSESPLRSPLPAKPKRGRRVGCDCSQKELVLNLMPLVWSAAKTPRPSSGVALRYVVAHEPMRGCATKTEASLGHARFGLLRICDVDFIILFRHSPTTASFGHAGRIIGMGPPTFHAAPGRTRQRPRRPRARLSPRGLGRTPTQAEVRFGQRSALALPAHCGRSSS